MLLRDCSQVLPSETADKAGEQTSRPYLRGSPPLCKQTTKQPLSEAPSCQSNSLQWWAGRNKLGCALLCGMTPVWAWGVMSCQTAGASLSSSPCWRQSISSWAFFSKGYSPPALSVFSSYWRGIPRVFAFVHTSSTFVVQGSKVKEVCWEASSLRFYVMYLFMLKGCFCKRQHLLLLRYLTSNRWHWTLSFSLPSDLNKNPDVFRT